MVDCGKCKNIDEEKYFAALAATDNDSYDALFDNDKCYWCKHNPGSEMVDNFEERIMKDDAKVINFGVDAREITLYAFRYALGRMTYSTSTMSEHLIRNKDVLSKQDKKLICEEIEDAIKWERAGHACDIENWEKVVKEFCS